ncbi:MAG: outer membrane lipoprotein-sorting protein [Treponema sp.]|jgi:outer membrane lipoprotein-sorting protein|nr:outer membrane lipoprotein-sorting protein [Treponema sp.]
MKKFFGTMGFLVLILLPAGPGFSQNAYDIMKAADERYMGDTAAYTLTMTLISKRGSPRIRELGYYFKDYGDTAKTAMVFRSPKDVEGSCYLAWSYDGGRDDDTWIYLPGMKRTRRISGSGRNGDFMGSDFTYEDMGGRDLSQDDFTLKDEEAVDGRVCWLIEAKAKDAKASYAVRLIRIRKDNYVTAGAEYYDRQGKLLKRLKVSGIKQADGIWIAEKMEMTNVLNEHSTVIEIKDTAFNIPLEDSLFTVAAMEQGRLR